MLLNQERTDTRMKQVKQPWRNREPQPLILTAKPKPAPRTILLDLVLQPVARCGCGQPIEYGAAFCGWCGVRLQEALV